MIDPKALLKVLGVSVLTVVAIGAIDISVATILATAAVVAIGAAAGTYTLIKSLKPEKESESESTEKITAEDALRLFLLLNKKRGGS